MYQAFLSAIVTVINHQCVEISKISVGAYTKSTASKTMQFGDSGSKAKGSKL